MGDIQVPITLQMSRSNRKDNVQDLQADLQVLEIHQFVIFSA